MKDKTGEIRENTNGTKMKIIKYIRSDNIFVEFQDEYKYVVNCQYKEFKLGKIKNPYDKKVFAINSSLKKQTEHPMLAVIKDSLSKPSEQTDLYLLPNGDIYQKLR